MTTMQEEAIRAGDVAMGLLNEMLQAGIEPDVITYGCVCCRLSAEEEGGGLPPATRSISTRGYFWLFFVFPRVGSNGVHRWIP